MVVCSTSSCSSMPFHYSIIPDLSGFSSLLSPSHMLPFRVPSTATQPQGVTLTDCYHAGYSCWGLSRLLRLEVLWSRDCHHSVPYKAQQKEPSFVQSSGTNVINMISKYLTTVTYRNARTIWFCFCNAENVQL